MEVNRYMCNTEIHLNMTITIWDISFVQDKRTKLYTVLQFNFKISFRLKLKFIVILLMTVLCQMLITVTCVITNGCHSPVGSTPASYLRYHGSKSWPGDQLFWPRFCTYPQFLQKNARIVIQIRSWPLSSISFPIHYSLILSFEEHVVWEKFASTGLYGVPSKMIVLYKITAVRISNLTSYHLMLYNLSHWQQCYTNHK
jgi:hypothetical protein